MNEKQDKKLTAMKSYQKLKNKKRIKVLAPVIEENFENKAFYNENYA